MSKRNSRIFISLAALLMLILYIGAPIFLHEHLVNRLDYVALGLVVIASVPWLGYYLEEFEFWGIKAKLREVEELAAGNRQIAEELVISRNASLQQNTKIYPNNGQQKKEELEESEKLWRDLAGEYVSIRKSMSSGPERTAKMTSIFGQLEGIFRNFRPDKAQISKCLSEEDAGLQLAGIAWLHAHPDQILPDTVISVADNSNQNFIQYWALRVLNKYVDESGITNFSPRNIRQLKQLEQIMPRGTDRSYLVRRLNRHFRHIT